MKTNVMFAIVVASALAVPSSASAGVTFYGNRATFEAAAPGLSLIDFNDQVTSPNTFTSYGASTTISGVTFSTNTNLFAVTPAYFPQYDLGDGAVLSWQGGVPNILTVSLPGGTTAFGFDFGSWVDADFEITLVTGETFLLPSVISPTTSPAFAGFISTTAVASFTISGPDPALLDRFAFGSGTVPEPSSIISAALAAGLTAAAALRRRRSA